MCKNKIILNFTHFTRPSLPRLQEDDLPISVEQGYAMQVTVQMLHTDSQWYKEPFVVKTKETVLLSALKHFIALINIHVLRRRYRRKFGLIMLSSMLDGQIINPNLQIRTVMSYLYIRILPFLEREDCVSCQKNICVGGRRGSICYLQILLYNPGQS